MPTFLRSCTILYSARRWSQSVSNHRYNHSKFWLCKCVKPSKVSVKDQSQNSQGFQLSEFPVNLDEIACFGNNVACQTWSLWIYYTKSSFTDQRIIQKSWKKNTIKLSWWLYLLRCKLLSDGGQGYVFYELCLCPCPPLYNIQATTSKNGRTTIGSIFSLLFQEMQVPGLF